MEISLQNTPSIITEVPEAEKRDFANLIKEYRARHIKSSSEIVSMVIKENLRCQDLLREKKVSECILKIRQLAWEELELLFKYFIQFIYLRF